MTDAPDLVTDAELERRFALKARALASAALMRAKWHDSMSERIAALLRPGTDG